MIAQAHTGVGVAVPVLTAIGEKPIIPSIISAAFILLSALFSKLGKYISFSQRILRMSKKNWKKGRPTSSKEEVKYQLSFDPSRIDPRRLLQIMCKPPEWCKIEALHRRLYIWPEKIARRKKKPGGKKSANCCRWRTSAAWKTSRAYLKRP
ncbi:MAG: hypothetical protein ACLRNQ_11795 [Flavonifractor plautii]